MTLQKPRDPKTFEAAIGRIAGVLGLDYVAGVVGKSTALVYKWGDPDCDQKPNIEQVHMMDEAMQAATGEAPITAVLLRKLKRSPQGHACRDLPERLCELMEEVGDIANAQRLALDPKGPGGSIITPIEYATLSGEVSEAITALEKYQRDLDAFYTASRSAAE